MSGLKLPAYGKALLARRRGGDHPLEVALIFGHQWRADVGGLPILAINPEDYTPEKFDFHVIAGVRVAVHDQEMWAAECDENVLPNTFGVFYDLLAELARFAAPVVILWPVKSGWKAREASDLAFNLRWMDRAQLSEIAAGAAIPAPRWPRWWSDDLDAGYRRRWTEWIDYYATVHDVRDLGRAEAA